MALHKYFLYLSRMTFFRWRMINGRAYLYSEERWRENGKVRSRSTIVKTGPNTPRQAAMERYREALRDNVYLYGKGHPGERYAREAQARQEYHRFLDAEKRGVPMTPGEAWVRIDGRPTSAFESRARDYAVSHPSPAMRVESKHEALRAEVQAEDALLNVQKAEAHLSQESPTDEEEAMHSTWNDNMKAEAEEQEAEDTGPTGEGETV